MKRILLVSIALASMVMLLSNASWANVPAPPANQQLGIDDTIFNNLEAADCRACHDSATHPCSNSNVDRHHLQYGNQLKQGKCSVNLNSCLSDAQCNPGICEINGTPCTVDSNCPDFPLGETCGEVCRGETAAPDLDADNNGVTDTLYSCLSCHRQETVGGIIRFVVERDCLVCHIQIPGEGSVHHLTQTAQGPAPLGDPAKGDCTPCHGTIVDDIGDGHLIPAYTPSLVTPQPAETRCSVSGKSCFQTSDCPSGQQCIRVENAPGGCTYCHNAGTDTATGILVYSNEDLHHNTGVYLSETGAVIDSTCTWCHLIPPPTPTASLKIRRCEGCHGLDSLHNIAADSATNCFYNPADPTCVVNIGGEAPGYSHVGNDSDCFGCHGFNASYADGSGPATPSISGSEDLVMTAGTDTPFTLTGAVFTNLISDWQWVSDIEMRGDNGTSVTLTPSSITAGSITVTIPGSTPPGNYALRAVKAYEGTAYAESNPVVISVIPAVVVSEAVSDGSTLTITGTGFGEAPPAGAEEYLNVKVNGQVVDVISWTDTQIVAALPAFGASADGGTFTVSALYCNSTGSFQGGSGNPTTTTSVPVCTPECAGNFDLDQDVDGTDAAAFKVNYGRNQFNQPCSPATPCNGDFNCDGDVDGSDAAVFKQDYGRSSLLNPCPACRPTCSY